MQGICPNATQQVDCGARTLDGLCPAPQTITLPVPKRFFVPLETESYSSITVSLGISEAAQFPHSHGPTDLERPQPAHVGR